MMLPAAFAQEISFGTPAVQTVKIQIDESGNAHVTHTIKESRSAQHLTVISNDFANLKIYDENGNSAEYAETGGEKMGLLILPSEDDVIVEYDLEDAVTQTGKLWSWNYYYLASTIFYLPEGTSLIFANSNPVLLNTVDGVRCHGCLLKLEYELQSDEKVQQITWEDKTFDVRVLTTGQTSELKFDQPNKMISIDILEKDQYVTLAIPKELLWNPYEVFLNEKKVLKHEFYQTEDLVWLNFKPNETGTVSIIGVSAVPEFPLATVLVLGAAMLVVAKLSGRFSRR